MASCRTTRERDQEVSNVVCQTLMVGGRFERKIKILPCKVEIILVTRSLSLPRVLDKRQCPDPRATRDRGTLRWLCTLGLTNGSDVNVPVERGPADSHHLSDTGSAEIGLAASSSAFLRWSAVKLGPHVGRVPAERSRALSSPSKTLCRVVPQCRGKLFLCSCY